MKLVLASQGFMNDKIANEVSKLVGKPLDNINVAIINEAYVVLGGDKSKRWLINELSRIEKYIGGRIDFVNLRAHSKEEIRKRLLDSDLVYIVGGKQFALPSLLKELNLTDVIEEVAKKDIVIMGTSAGANLLGKHIESKDFWKERYDIEEEKIENKTLGLIGVNIIPHYLRKDRSNWTEEFFERTLKDNPFKVYALTDDEALFYDNGKMYFVGNPRIFGDKDR